MIRREVWHLALSSGSRWQLKQDSNRCTIDKGTADNKILTLELNQKINHRYDGMVSRESAVQRDSKPARATLAASFPDEKADNDPAALDRAAAYLVANSNRDGGWRYRPGSNLGPENGGSSHNMTLAGVSTTAICRLLLYNPPKNKAPVEKQFGILSKSEDDAKKTQTAFPNFKPVTGRGQMEKAIARGISWNRVRFMPVPKTEFQLYFYYTLERAAALAEFDGDWFTTYGDGLLTLQKDDGHFNSHSTASGPAVGTSFAILYYTRSTGQILGNLYGAGKQSGGRGFKSLFGSKKAKAELGPLDELLGALENVDFSALEDVEAVVEKVQFGSKEELVGQIDKLKLLAKSNNAANRRAAYFALGRTGDFNLIPDMLQGLRDKNLDVNVEALRALRYISRKPNGFGISENPLEGPQLNSDEEKLIRANQWRTKAYRTWGKWYRGARVTRFAALTAVEKKRASKCTVKI